MYSKKNLNIVKYSSIGTGLRRIRFGVAANRASLNRGSNCSMGHGAITFNLFPLSFGSRSLIRAIAGLQGLQFHHGREDEECKKQDNYARVSP